MLLSVTSKNFHNSIFKSKVIYEDSNIPLTSQEKDYIDRFEEGRTYDHRFLGEGVVSKAFYSSSQDFVIKQNKVNSYLPSKERNEFGSLAHENKMLLKIDPNVKTTQRGKAYVETKKGGKFLISSFVSGKPANRYTNPFKEKHIDRLLRNLYRLDKSFIIHSDLSNPNLLLDTNDNVNLIDYQWADEYDLYYDYCNFNLRNSSFPPFESPNNASMFEAAGLAGYTRPMSIDQAKNFLKKYYENKTHYVEKNIRRLEEINKQSGMTLGRAIEFEKSRAKAYGYMDENILNAETHKMNILNLHRRQFSCHDLNKVDPRNILRAIPLCIRAKECADALANYDEGAFVDETYYSYMRQFGEFWQENIEKWYTQTLKWIFKLVSREISDPVKVYFPEKIDDYNNLDIVKSSWSYTVPRKFSSIDLQLRELFKNAHLWGYNSRYCEKQKAYRLIEQVFRK